MASCKPTDLKCRPKPYYLCNFQELADAINGGTTVVETPNYQLIQGATYNLPANVQSITVDVLADATAPTLDTGSGAVALSAGQKMTFSAPYGQSLDNTTFEIVAGASDLVAIYAVLLT